MTWVSTMFHKGGPTMLLITALILPALGLVGVHIGLRRKWSLWTSIGVIALILGIGVFGMMVGRGRTEEAAQSFASKQDRALLLEEGYEEASVPLKYAGLVAVVLLAGVMVAQLRGRREVTDR